MAGQVQLEAGARDRPLRPLNDRMPVTADGQVSAEMEVGSGSGGQDLEVPKAAAARLREQIVSARR